jgi:sugar lactone lactonase YvrE
VARAVALVVPGTLAAAALYLAAWPVLIEPVAWTPPPLPPRAGAYAPNDRLAAVEWLGRGVALGPEAVAVDREGRVHTGTRDGRILRLRADDTFEEVARTGGRPLGLAFAADGTLYVCDLEKGLLAMPPGGAPRVVASSHAGVPFRFADDVDVAPDGTVYFSDASSRFSVWKPDIFEHRGNGRLLAYHPATGATDLVLGGLHFANGVAVGPGGRYVLVNETGSYRILRVWLAGPRRGQYDVFLDALPGFPDNITWSPGRRVFWVALFAPRLPTFDWLQPRPWLRKVVFRLPEALQPAPVRHAWVLGVDEEGRVRHDLEDASSHSFSPITSAREHSGLLYLGSLQRDAVGRIRAP